MSQTPGGKELERHKKENTKETVSEWIHKVMEPVEENEYEKSSISG